MVCKAKMDFVDKAITNECVDLRPQNATAYLNSGPDQMANYDMKNVFSDLENGLSDLKIAYNDSTAKQTNANKFTNFNSTDHRIDTTDDHKSFNGLTNGQFNAQLNSNSHSINSNLISQSYELAKVANEFKEKLNDVYTAITYYNKSIALNPYEGRFYVNRSICLQQANRLNEALDDANRAISLMPNTRKPFLRKAEIFQMMNKFNDAENCLNYCLKSETANDIPIDVVRDEIQKLIKTALTRCGIGGSIIKQTNHCNSIEEAIDYAFGKQMEEKLNSQHRFAAAPTNTNNIMNHNEKGCALMRADKRPPTIPISKSLDSQETVDYFTDEEIANTPNRKLSINEEMFTFNLQSPSFRKDSLSFTFNQIETAKHFLHLNNNNYNLNNEQTSNLIENSSSLANLNCDNEQFIRNSTQSIGIPIMNRKRNSLCEPIDSFNVKSLNLDRFSNSSNFFDSAIERRFYAANESIYSKSLGSNLGSIHRNFSANKQDSFNDAVEPSFKDAVERANQCTNLVGYKGLWLGNISSSCSRERLISIFRKYGEPIVHQVRQFSSS